MHTRMLVLEAALCLAAFCATAAAAPAASKPDAQSAPAPEIVCDLHSCRTVTPAVKPASTQKPEHTAKTGGERRGASPHQ